jgi:hypothetical protein
VSGVDVSGFGQALSILPLRRHQLRPVRTSLRVVMEASRFVRRIGFKKGELEDLRPQPELPPDARAETSQETNQLLTDTKSLLEEGQSSKPVEITALTGLPGEASGDRTWPTFDWTLPAAEALLCAVGSSGGQVQIPNRYNLAPAPAWYGTGRARPMWLMSRRPVSAGLVGHWFAESYDLLSAVALAITGARWSGPRFFRL